MKYAMTCGRAAWEDDSAFPESAKQEMYGAAVEWFGRLAAQGKVTGGEQLQGPETARTVALTKGGGSTVVDGPFLVDGKLALGGYIILEVADFDEAIALTRTFPIPESKVEVRPVIER
ncbi:MAG: YciI family protein [Candidatus Dormibacter sp.]|uniref:YciI family protein n=1 Tax=Candidatus Dormibacter sp. TaxID=2973982 RepID=UPI000DB36E3D|nr:MAG: hypothetical protein DLM66_03910 [Candidatus Dormibacteraeota bacterium]